LSEQTLLRSTGVMAAGTFVSRLLGFVRAALLSGVLGISGFLAADAFVTANTVPNQIYNLIAGGLLNAVLVPQITRAARHEDGGQAFLDRLLTLSLLVLGGVTVLAVALAPLVPVVLQPSGDVPWDAATRALCVAFAVWCLPQVFFYGVYTVLGQVLNARGRFGAYMWAPVVNNVVAVAGLLVLLRMIGEASRANPHPPAGWTGSQVAVLAGTATLGVALQALVLLVPLRRSGFRYRPRLGLRGVGLGTAGRVAGWTFAAAVVGQLGFLVTVKAVNAGGAGGGPGQNAYGNAFLLFMLPHSLVTVSLVTALFTRMSRAAAEDDVPGVRRDLSVGLRLTGVATVLALTAMLAVGRDQTRTQFWQNGTAETDAVAWATTAMMLGLVSFSAQYLFQRVFYALEDARTPFLVQLPVVATIAVTSYLSGRLLDPSSIVIGVGVGMAAGYTVGAVLSAWLLHRRLGRLDGARVLRTYVRLACAAVPAGLAGWAVSRLVHAVLGDGLAGHAVALVLGGLVVLAGYLAACRAMRVREVDDVAGPLLRRLPAPLRPRR
jgi:putative peptidoglycan lipid II flippase